MAGVDGVSLVSKRPSPETRHRVDLWRRHDPVRCYARHLGECKGILQAAHWISRQQLKQERSKVNVSRHRFEGDDRLRLLDHSIEDLVADGRNGVPLCVEHHNAFDGKRAYSVELVPPGHVRAFAADYGLLHLLEDRPAEADPYIERGLLGALIEEDEE